MVYSKSLKIIKIITLIKYLLHNLKIIKRTRSARSDEEFSGSGEKRVIRVDGKQICEIETGRDYLKF